MPQIMVEAFARSLIDNIMIEAFDVVETDDEKLQMVSDQQKSADIQSQPTKIDLHIQDLSRLDDPKQTEITDSTVHGLSNLQIGDNTSVPYRISKLETQVKHIARIIDNVSPSDTMKIAETRTAQGQGDVHQVIHDAVIETTSPTCSRLEKEPGSENEATKVSLSLLHQMIEELETKVEEGQKSQENELESVSKEKIFPWEETVERFIRTIDSTELPEQDIDSQLETILRSTGCYLSDGEMASVPIVHSTPFVRSNSLKEVTIEEIAASSGPEQEAGDPSNEVKAQSCNGAQPEEQKKRGMFGRTRKLFRNIFGRRKK